MHAGISEMTPAYYKVKAYLDIKKLSEIGYHFSGDKLGPEEIATMIAISDEMIKAEQEVLPKLKPKAKHGRSTN